MSEPQCGFWQEDCDTCPSPKCYYTFDDDEYDDDDYMEYWLDEEDEYDYEM